jgi:hypothetical protein
MRPSPRSNGVVYMQIYECINAATSRPCGADAPLTREQSMEAESLTDVQDEEDPEAYGSRLLGVAAYQRVESDVRVVHEFLVSPVFGERQAATVTEEPFERRGYRAVVLDAHLAWLQKTLDQGSCIHVGSQHLH